MASRPLYNYRRPQGRGLPLRKLIQNIPKFSASDRKGRSALVKIVGLKAGKSRSTHLMTFVARTSSPELYGLRWVVQQYATSIIFLNADEKDGRVRISCSCPDFKFRAEWACWRVGSAEIRYSNGAPPRKMNPKGIPYICKHGLKLAYTLRELKRLSPNFFMVPKKALPNKNLVTPGLLKKLPRMGPGKGGVI